MHLSMRPWHHVACHVFAGWGQARGCTNTPPPPPQHISAFVDWLCAQLRRPSNPTRSVPTSVSALCALLRERGGRQLLLRAGGVQLLPPFLRSFNSPTNSQLLYELCMCVWQMSYVKQAAEAMGQSGEAPIRG